MSARVLAVLLAAAAEARPAVRAALSGGAAGRGAEALSANSAVQGSRLWAYGRVPFFVGDIATESTLLEIRRAMAHIEDRVCLRFAKCATREECTGPHLYFSEEDGGCRSPVGVWGRNEINLRGCTTGATIHEILHSMGFEHEHKRKDRDQHVSVNMNYVRPSNRGSDFATMHETSRDVGPYDYDSILQYDAYAWTTDQRVRTIVAPYPLGQSTSMSPLDVENLQWIYNGCSAEFAAPTCRASVTATNFIAHSKTWSVEFNGLYGGLWAEDGKAVAGYTPLISHSRVVFSTDTNMRFGRFEFTPNAEDDAGRTFTFGVRVEGNDGTSTECSVEVEVAADDAVCFGVSESDPAVCSGHGRCTGNVGNPCECNYGITGHACSNCPFVPQYAFEEAFGTWHEDDDVAVDFSFAAVGRGSLRIGDPSQPRRVDTQLDVYPVSKPDTLSFHVAPMGEAVSTPMIRMYGVDDSCFSLTWDPRDQRWALDRDALLHGAVKHGAREWNFFEFDVDYVAARVTVRANGVEIVSNHPMPASCSTGVEKLRFFEMMYIDDVQMTCGEPSPVPTPAPTPQPPTPAPTPTPPTQAPPPCSDRATWCSNPTWLRYCHVQTIAESCPGTCNKCPSTPAPQIPTPAPVRPTPQPPVTVQPPTPEPTTATPQPTEATPIPTTAEPIPQPPTAAVTVSMKDQGSSSVVTAAMGSVVDGYSPRYPSGALHRVTVIGARCKITWTHMDVEPHSTCRYDYVELLDGTTSKGRFCGQSLPEAMELTSSSFEVVLRTDSSVQATGFAFDFVCDGSATPVPSISDAPPTPAPTPLPTPTPVPVPVTPAPVTPAPDTPAPVTPAPVTPVPDTPAPVSCSDNAGEDYCTRYAHLCRYASFSATCQRTCGVC